MARSRTSFQKRQKEIARMEKQREKIAKRMQRKLAAKQTPDAEGTPTEELTEPADPLSSVVE